MAKNTLENIKRYVKCKECDDLSIFKEETTAEFYVRYPSIDGKGFEITKLNSKKFQNWVFVKAQSEATVPNKSSKFFFYDHTMSLSEAGGFIKAWCAYAENDPSIPETKLLPRVGFYDGKIYLNLHNKAHKVVEISAEGWKVIDEYQDKVLFAPNNKALELPEPQTGGSFSDLRSLLPINERDFCSFVFWLVSALNPSSECPILCISGDHGTGKSTLTRIAKMLIDPDNAGVLAPFAKSDDLYAASSSRYIVSIDNVSKINKNWSDRFCRLTTGTGISKRKNYSDNEAFDLHVRNPLIINGIGFEPNFDDFMDRCVFIHTEPFKSQRTSQEIEEAFEAKRPLIVGILLDAVVAALKNESYKPSDVDFRMKGTAEFVMRAANAGALPFSEQQLHGVLEERSKKLKAEGLKNNLLVRVICKLIDENFSRTGEAKIEGLSSNLWETTVKEAKSLRNSPINIPNSAKDFGIRMSQLQKQLESIGIIFKTKHVRGGTKMIFEKKFPQLSVDVLNAENDTMHSHENNLTTAPDTAEQEMIEMMAEFEADMENDTDEPLSQTSTRTL